ncbi:MAG: hypothetical protein K0U12_04070, partial [Gammaproteobacteria bacterium]|nr:hypothetical protein [Gammaproteobacteria bacterium]
EDDGYADFVELLANQRDMIIRNIRHAINFQMDIYQVFNGVLAVIWQTVNSWLVDNEWKEVEFKLGDWDWSDDMQRFLCLYMVYEVFLAVNISLNHLILPTDRGDAISDFSESDRCCCFNLSARTSKRSIASAPQHQNLSSASVAALKKVGVIDRFAVKKNALAWYWKFLTASAMLLEIGAGLALSFLFPPAAPIIAPYLGKLIYWQLGLFAAGLTLLAHLSHIGLQDLPVAQIADLNPELVNAAPATQRHQESQAVERLDAANNPHRIFSGHDRHSRGGALSSLTIDAAAAFNEARDNTLSPTGSFHSVVLSPLVQQSIHSPRSPLSQVASEVPTSRPMSPTSDGP